MKVKVGVRPEDMVKATGVDYLYEGTVNITEALGEVTLLYFVPEGDADPIIGKLPGIHAEMRSKTVRLGAVPEKVHLFANGQSLLYR